MRLLEVIRHAGHVASRTCFLADSAHLASEMAHHDDRQDELTALRWGRVDGPSPASPAGEE